MPDAGWEAQLRGALQGRQPLIYLRTAEEDRALAGLRRLAAEFFPGGGVVAWSCTRGFEPGAGKDANNPVSALERIAAESRRGIWALKDLTPFLTDPRVERGLRDLYDAFCRDFRAAAVLLSADPPPPGFLDKELRFVEMEPPSPEELSRELDGIEAQYAGARLSRELRPQVLLALRGLTLREAGHVLRRVFAGGQRDPLEEIFAEKRALARKAGFLEFVPLRWDLSAIGGLANAKTWAAQRADLFNQKALDAGLPVPKGVLVMGVSGCGKSLLAKAIAGLWKVPLFRLDMSLIFSGLFGSPEAAFHRALRTVEAVAPVVLWIDEMESSLSAPKDAATPQAMTFSAFLTWMQEKPPLVFVAATANRIELLPAEVIRKGRFDQVFFCDLPNDDERAEIFQIQLRRNGADPEAFAVDRLVSATDTLSGAEIEQLILSALIEARQEGRAMTTDDLWRQTFNVVPLSRTMSEQVKAIRQWALNRAVLASSRPYQGAAR